jgi:N-acetylmuramoyl-L-alanine amidase
MTTPTLVIQERPSPNHGVRAAARRIDMLILHYTGMPSAAAALERMCDPAAEVSAHYCIDEDGTIWRLVAEKRRAWHAGRSFWAGESDINSRSIGIELVNPGHEFGYRPFPEAQIRALEALCRDILARHAIPPARILGHSDIAPERKEDPGEFFPWERLATAGIGLWPVFGAAAPAADMAAARTALAKIGYAAPAGDIGAVLTAFQRHWRPERCDGALDGETAQRIADVAAAVSPLS